MKRKERKARRLFPLLWVLASLAAGAGAALLPSAASARDNMARAAYAARVAEMLRERVYLDMSAHVFRLDPRRLGPGFARIQFEIDPSGRLKNVRVLAASSYAHARQAEAIVSGVRMPPPPDSRFAAQQTFNFR